MGGGNYGSGIFADFQKAFDTVDHNDTKTNKIRHYVDIKTLKSIYHAIFELHLSYASLVWA